MANVRAARYEIDMKFSKSLPRPWLWGVLMLTAVATASWGEEFQIIQYKPPAGWKVEERPGKEGLVLTSPDSTPTQQALILVVLAPPQDGLDLTASFDAAVKGLSSDGKVIESNGRTSSS